MVEDLEDPFPQIKVKESLEASFPLIRERESEETKGGETLGEDTYELPTLKGADSFY